MELGFIGIVALLSFLMGVAYGDSYASKPTTQQSECDFCHKITKNGVCKPVTDLIYGIIEYGKYDEWKTSGTAKELQAYESEKEKSNGKRKCTGDWKFRSWEVNSY